MAGAITTAQQDPTPLAGSKIGFWDTSVNALRNMTFANLQAWLQTYLMPFVSPGSIGNVLTSAGSSWISAAPSGDGMIGSRNLVGQNNASTPNTKFDFSADMVCLRNPSAKQLNVQTNTGTITCDITLPASGSVSTANGCDQSKISALTSVWVHFYWIWNGSTLATLASQSAPPTGPTLPSGYTSWAYIGAVYLDGSSHFITCRIQGNTLYYPIAMGGNMGRVLAAGTATTETSVSCSAWVPPNATSILFALTAQVGGTNNQYDPVVVGWKSGNNFYILVALYCVTGTTISSVNTGECPNNSQTLYYHWVTPASVAYLAYIDICGFRIPNGSS